MAYPSSSAARNADGVGTLRLLVYLALAIGLMAADHRGGWLSAVRAHASVLVEPIWWLAALPSRIGDGVHDSFATRRHLAEENQMLREQLLVESARRHRLEAVVQENQRLRDLLGGTRGYRLSVQLASILDIDLDPFRQRVILDLGENAGVQVGQALIDAGGVAGQVIEVMPRQATALMITDPDHAVPVQVLRSGLRLIVYGTGRRDQLLVPNIPQSGDIREGDELVTSGVGGRFPAGFPVARVQALRPDESRSFMIAEAMPAARLDRAGEVLLVWNAPVDPGIGPPAPAQPPVGAASAATAEPGVAASPVAADAAPTRARPRPAPTAREGER